MAASPPQAAPLAAVYSHPSAWTARHLRQRPQEWRHKLTEEDIAELERAAEDSLNAAGNGQLHRHLQTKADFPLPTLGPKLEAIRQEVMHGRGFALITGVPVERWTRAQTVAAYYGIGLHWGHAVSNNSKGHLVGHIKDIGHDASKPDTRLYATSAPQPYHNDASDLVALLCLHAAEQGGTSHWASSTSVHNKICTTRPDLAQVLSGPWFFDRKGEVPPGGKGWFEIPVFNHFQGRLSVNYSDNYFFLSQRHEDVPRLTPAHLEAIRVFNDFAASEELRMDYDLQPGDIQLLNNHTCLHSRSGFVDHADPLKKRHLLRLWLSPEDAPPLPPPYAELLGGSVEPGKRGGIVCEGTVLNIPLEAE